MPNSLGINRNVNTLSLSAAATLGPDVDQVVANATSSGFTITLCDFSDGAAHQVIITISPSDSSGNTVTVQGNAAAFSTTLASNGTTSVTLQTQADGTWFVMGFLSVTSAATASSTATSQNASQSLNVSSAQSGVTSEVLQISSANSGITSQGLNVSSAQSGVTSNSLITSQTGSNATSAVASGSLNTSSAGSTATSQNASQSLVISLVSSVANSG